MYLFKGSRNKHTQNCRREDNLNTKYLLGDKGIPTLI